MQYNWHVERLRRQERAYERARLAESEGLGQEPGEEESWGAWYSSRLRLSLCAAMSYSLYTATRRERGGGAVGGIRGTGEARGQGGRSPTTVARTPRSRLARDQGSWSCGPGGTKPPD